MSNLLIFIEGHAAIILICLIIFFLIDGIGRIFYYGRRKTKTSFAKNKYDKALFDAINSSETCAYILKDAQSGITLSVGGNITEIVGVKVESVFIDGEIIYRGFSDESRKEFIEKYSEWNHESPLTFESNWISPNEEEKIKCYVITVTSVDEGVHNLFAIRDNTKETEKIEHLKQEIEIAKQSSESKTAFLSNMSHEIRTPLNGMLGMISLAKMNLDNKQSITEYLEKAEELSRFLLSVINDILDMSRIESGKTELEAVPFDIRQTAEKIGSMFSRTIQEKGISFNLELIDVQNPYVIGDELRLTQVLTNFLSNSSKFTETGGIISLSVKQMNLLAGNTSWMFRVKDTGKGMSQEFLHKLFKPFEQEDSGIARKYGGSGLGMAIADNIIKLMDGQILVESEIGEGTTFTVLVKFPVADEKDVVVKSDSIPEIENVSLEGRKILLAEDHIVNATIVVKMLGTQGIMVEVAENGKMAVEMFNDSDVNYYDAVLMDIQMPEMNGWDATKNIRNLQRADATTVPIYALSADAFVEDKRKSTDIGMNGHITKPIDFNELKKTLQKEFREHR